MRTVFTSGMAAACETIPRLSPGLDLVRPGGLVYGPLKWALFVRRMMPNAATLQP